MFIRHLYVQDKYKHLSQRDLAILLPDNVSRSVHVNGMFIEEVITDSISC